MTIRVPRSGAWGAVHPDAKLFCVATAVIRFNCFRRIIATLASRHLEIPCLGYFGDFAITTPLPLTEDAPLVSTALNNIFGSRSSDPCSICLRPQSAFTHFCVSVSKSGKLKVQLAEIS